MFRLDKLSIRQKLYGLVVISTLGLAAVAGLSAWLLMQFRVSGPVYDRVIGAKDFLGDVSPSPIYIIEPFVTLYQLDEARCGRIRSCGAILQGGRMHTSGARGGAARRQCASLSRAWALP